MISHFQSKSLIGYSVPRSRDLDIQTMSLTRPFDRDHQLANFQHPFERYLHKNWPQKIAEIYFKHLVIWTRE